MVFKIIFVLVCALHFSKSKILGLDKSVKTLIQDYGYLMESHNVITRDGYILEIHRIPGTQEKNIVNQKNKPVVLMMHGLLCSSVDWIITGPNRSLAFLLVENGYDVWLGNNRGNTFGKNHTSYLSTSIDFWNFSWHELGMFDLPAIIDYILKITKKEDLNYVCFSQGCTQFFVMGSLKPEYNKKIRFTTALSPASFMKNVKGLSSDFRPFFIFSQSLTEKLGYFEFLPSFSFLRILTNYGCREGSGFQDLCYFLLFYAVGMGVDEMDRTQLADILAHFPAGCSWKQIIHYIHGSKGTFGQFDYGRVENLRLYNSTVPPEYPLKNVNVPISIFHGTEDFLTTPKLIKQFSFLLTSQLVIQKTALFSVDKQDIAMLAKKLPNVVGKFLVTERKLNHLDFIYGKNIRNLVYNRVLAIIKSFTRY